MIIALGSEAVPLPLSVSNTGEVVGGAAVIVGGSGCRVGEEGKGTKVMSTWDTKSSFVCTYNRRLLPLCSSLNLR